MWLTLDTPLLRRTVDMPLLRHALRAGFAVRYGILPSQWAASPCKIGNPADLSHDSKGRSR